MRAQLAFVCFAAAACGVPAKQQAWEDVANETNAALGMLQGPTAVIRGWRSDATTIVRACMAATPALQRFRAIPLRDRRLDLDRRLRAHTPWDEVNMLLVGMRSVCGSASATAPIDPQRPWLLRRCAGSCARAWDRLVEKVDRLREVAAYDGVELVSLSTQETWR